MGERNKNASNEQEQVGEVLKEWDPAERLGSLCIMRLLMREPCKIPPLLTLMECADTGDFQIDAIARQQMWDCENSDEILSECKYEVAATEMLSRTMPYRERADMLMDYMEALIELVKPERDVLDVCMGRYASGNRE